MLHDWLDGEVDAMRASEVEGKSKVELWTRINAESEMLRRRVTPVGVQQRIMASLPEPRYRGQLVEESDDDHALPRLRSAWRFSRSALLISRRSARKIFTQEKTPDSLRVGLFFVHFHLPNYAGVALAA